MTDVRVIDLKAFVPAKDYALSQQFYLDLGFTRNWANDEVAEFQIGDFRFLLQNFFAQSFADNYMMQLMVADADAWWAQIQDQSLTQRYPGARAKPPAMQPWGLRELHLIDPTGVLWHIAEQSATR